MGPVERRQCDLAFDRTQPFQVEVRTHYVVGLSDLTLGRFGRPYDRHKKMAINKTRPALDGSTTVTSAAGSGRIGTTGMGDERTLQDVEARLARIEGRFEEFGI